MNQTCTFFFVNRGGKRKLLCRCMINSSTSSMKAVHDIYTIAIVLYTIALLTSDFQFYMYPRTLGLFIRKGNISKISSQTYCYFSIEKFHRIGNKYPVKQSGIPRTISMSTAIQNLRKHNVFSRVLKPVKPVRRLGFFLILLNKR